jgi:hypothetical protein
VSGAPPRPSAGAAELLAGVVTGALIAYLVERLGR